MRTANGIDIFEYPTHSEFRCSDDISCVLIRNMYRMNIVCKGKVVDTIDLDPEMKMEEVYKLIEKHKKTSMEN